MPSVREQQEIVRMRRMYRMKPVWPEVEHDYRAVRLEHSYDTEVLSPFVDALSQRGHRLTVLDVGSGTGEAADMLERRGIRAVRLDVSDSMVSRLGSEAVQATAWQLPFPDGTFDGVHTKDMMLHIKPALRPFLFEELRRVLRPGGRLLVSSAQDFFLFDKEYYSTNRGGLVRCARRAGFSLLESWSWKPKERGMDWYRSKTTGRFVLMLAR